MKDPIIVDRKTFLDLIAAAEQARTYLATHAPGTDYANRVRRDLNNALPPAVSSDGSAIFEALRQLRYLLAVESDTRGQIVPGIKKERQLSPELEECREILRKTLS